MIPLDDLLPTNDDSFEPVPSGKFFDTGSPYWEFSDIFKWGNQSTEFQFGFYAGLFEMILKSGRPFSFRLLESLELHLDSFITRAQEYNREVESEKKSYWVVISVGGHKGD
jgi:hypothetical protein